jgi:hypothetical protein
MYNFNFIEKIIPPVHRPINKFVYVFPINGMDMSKIEEMKIGYVTFMDKIIAKTRYNIDNFDFNADTYALVDFSKQAFKLHYQNGMNSIALKILKETIGFINIVLYDRLSLDKERKIMISNINKHILEEGLIRYLSINSDDVINVENARFDTVDLTMTTSEMRLLKYNNKNWIDLLEQNFEDRSELHKKLLKGLEYIYYISNEIYASERIIKYFIVLNNIFRVDGVDLNRKGIAKYLNLIFSRVKPIQVFHGNFNREFEVLYDGIRNNIMHGILNLDGEEGLIDSNDFHSLKVLFYELLIAITESDDIFVLNTTKDLNSYLESLIHSPHS